MSKLVTNKTQMEQLVKFMEENTDIARGVCVKTQAKRRWEKIAIELNCLGPPIRTWEKWLKVWTDLKFKVKKKKSENNIEMKATGGGPNKLHTFCALEDSVISILSVDTIVEPPGLEFGKGEECFPNTENYAVSSPNTPECIKNTENYYAASSPNENIADIQLETPQTSSTARALKYPKEIKDSIKTIEEYTKKCYYLKKDTNNELLAMKKERLKIYKDEVRSKQKARITKLKLKEEILEQQREMQMREAESSFP